MPAKEPEKSAAPFIEADASLPELREAAAHCTGCDLYKNATQTVFGEGPEDAAVMLVGEQPGGAEDRSGRPFVGPAGRLLDKALAEAGIDRSQVYVTNAVKHFKWTIVRGHKRLHQTPQVIEVRACAPWLRAEIERIRPRIVILLGASAAKSVLGPGFRVTQQRGQPMPSDLAERVVATVHPSSLLRTTDPEARARAYDEFVDDLKKAAAGGARR